MHQSEIVFSNQQSQQSQHSALLTGSTQHSLLFFAGLQGILLAKGWEHKVAVVSEQMSKCYGLDALCFGLFWFGCFMLWGFFGLDASRFGCFMLWELFSLDASQFGCFMFRGFLIWMFYALGVSWFERFTIWMFYTLEIFMVWIRLDLDASRFGCFILWKFLWFGFFAIWMLHDLNASCFGYFMLWRFFGLDALQFGNFLVHSLHLMAFCKVSLD